VIGLAYWMSTSTSVLFWSALSFSLGLAIFGPTTILTLQVPPLSLYLLLIIFLIYLMKVQESAQPRSSAQTIVGVVALLANFGAGIFPLLFLLLS